MTDLEGVGSQANAVAKLAKNGDHALAERRRPALGQPLADGQQGVCRKTRPLACAINDGGPNAHLRFLRVRGARRFSRSSNAPTLRFARLRSVVMPRLRPYSWPDRNAKPTKLAVKPVAIMIEIGSMCLFSVA